MIAAGVLFGVWFVSWLWLKESPVDIGLPEPAANPANVFGSRRSGGSPAEPARAAGAAGYEPRVSGRVLLVAGADVRAQTFNTWSTTYYTDVLGIERRDGGQLHGYSRCSGGAERAGGRLARRSSGAGGPGAVIFAGCLLAAVVLVAWANRLSGRAACAGGFVQPARAF